MSSEPAPNAAQLWNVLRTYLRQAGAQFGDPSDIACAGVLTRAQAKEISAWLAPLEALLRRLLYLMAHALKLAPTQPHAHKPRAARIRSVGQAPFDVEISTSWRVHFQLLPAPSHRAMRVTQSVQALRENASPPESVSAIAIAKRMEALIRVAANPEPYAAKLARKLAAQAEPDPPRAWLTAPVKRDNPLYLPAHQAAALICATLLPPAFANSS